MNLLGRPNVAATATVDDIAPGWWLVKITGKEPYDQIRCYQVKAETEREAAFEGIDRFVEDVTDDSQVRFG